MKAERWERVNELYHEALSRAGGEREAFLAEACNNDPEVLREVETLLRAHEGAGSFLDSPALEVAAQEMAEDSYIGRTLGHYEVLSRVGAGGMGEVYLARDLRLGRKLALKVLPRLYLRDRERVLRFEQEARAASALNHPNILTIFEIDEADGVRFMATEYVEGQTLREKLASGPLEVRESLEIAMQAALALETAHAAGIVHRDIKPENVMVRRDGYVKIVDFGIAKLLDPVSVETLARPTPLREVHTAPGALVGSLGYVSPEQLEGKSVDGRADVFGLGAVLYEMLSGRRSFEGETSREVVIAILHREPLPLSELGPEVARKVEPVVKKALEKDRDRRYQGARELLADLRTLSQELDRKWSGGEAEGRAATTTPSIRGARRALLAASLVGALLLATLASLLWLRSEPVPVLSNPVQVTRSIGAEAYPSWSPEGGRLAYHLSVTGHETTFDVWVAQVAGRQAVNLTEDHSGNDLYPSWSPDGSQIAFWSDRQGGGYFVMPALGGPARKVSEQRLDWWEATRPEWSRDGKELACVGKAEGAKVVRVVSLTSGEWRELPFSGREGLLDMSWSPDGRYLAEVNELVREASVTELRVLRVEDQEAFSVTDRRSKVLSPSWSSDGRYLYYVSNRVGTMDLWRQRMRDGRPAGKPEQVTAGTGMTSAVFSPDGKGLAYSRGRVVSNLWRVLILKDRPATWADAQQLTFDDAFIESLDVSPDGKRLLVDSDRSGNHDLWNLPAEGGEMEQVTTDPTPDWAPAWSPDGEEIAFYAYRSGNRQVWVQPAAGGPARQLTKGEKESGGPSWSSDGRTILYTLSGAGNEEIWTVPASGGEPRPMMMEPEYNPHPRWSPDGNWLVFFSKRSGSNGLWRARAGGQDPKLLVEAEAYAARWSPDARAIYYLRVGEEATNVWVVGVDGQGERPVTDLRGRRGSPGLAQVPLATDGSYLYFTWREELGDIWVADVTYPRLWH